MTGWATVVATLLCAALIAPSFVAPEPPRVAPQTAAPLASAGPNVVDNLSASIQRLVTLVGVAGGGLLTLVWVRVALSWFSSDLTKKIQAKDRARDALIGTLIFAAALSGLVWGLAHWVVTGS